MDHCQNSYNLGGSTMQKKFFKYVSPEVDVVILTQVDIITLSSGTNSGADGNQGDGNWWD